MNDDVWKQVRDSHAFSEHNEPLDHGKRMRLQEAWGFYILDRQNNFSRSRWNKWMLWLKHSAPILADNLATGEP